MPTDHGFMLAMTPLKETFKQSQDRLTSPSFQKGALSPSLDSDLNLLPTDRTQEESDEIPFCSVLNVVVDYDMVPPTPLELDEYQESIRDASLKLRVPLLRIFGPLIRGGALEPRQSACLYIHNAFPYLIARPIIAGPDGSLIHGARTDSILTSSGHIDWDCVESVQSILPQFQATLEATIQASFPDEITKPPRIIRRISIVVGRGFYTYCPGPAAPFLRVEYYDPKLRWKVKLMLERGINVPTSYHPDPNQYQDSLTAPSQLDEGSESLQFHCYEAHIPYTMQFFKDWNLAGMSYIHLSSGNLRRNLPRTQRRVLKNQDDQYPREDLFLQENTSEQYIWSEETYFSPDSIGHMEQSSNSSQESKLAMLRACPLLNIDPFWSRKETSCDVELDVSVNQIMNVEKIITDLPESEQEREQMHWRAVPSLKEIWRQERMRMSRLLSPKDDFLSQPLATPPFTLNVKKGESTPGARLAVLGMKQLFQVSIGLEDEFQRAMRQIIQRHLQAVQRVDHALQTRQSVAFAVPVSLNILSQSDYEAMRALGELAGQFGEVNEEHNHGNGRSRAGNLTTEDQMSQASACGCFDSLLFSQSKAKVSQKAEAHAFDFSQRMDRGEGVTDSRFEYVEDFINPKTLTPFEDLELNDEEDDENEMSEKAMEYTLSMLMSQTEYRINNQPELDTTADDFFHGTYVESLNSQMPTQELLEITETNRTSLETISPQHQAGCAHSIKPNYVESIRHQPTTTSVNRHNDDHLDKSDNHSITLFPNFKRSRLDFDLGVHPPSRKSVKTWCRMKSKSSNTKIPRSQLAGTNKNRFASIDPQMNMNLREIISLSMASKKGRSDELVSDQNTVIDIEGVGSELRRRDYGPQLQSHLGNVEKHLILVPFDNPQSGSRLELNSAQGFAQIPKMASTCYSESCDGSSQVIVDALEGIGQQGGRIHIEGGGGLKARTNITLTGSQAPAQRVTLSKGRNLGTDLPTPLSMISIEVHVQCRMGRAGVNDSKVIAMRPDSDKDKISAIVYIYAIDPGGGEAIRMLEKGCIFLPVEAELSCRENTNVFDSARHMASAIPRSTMGTTPPLLVEVAKNEKQLLLRIASIVRQKDPDMLLSWDTQGAGLGFMIERGAVLGKAGVDGLRSSPNSLPKYEIDMARLLGRTPSAKDDCDARLNELPKQPEIGSTNELKQESQWKGSGLGADWDERVGAGVAAASVAGRIIFAGWKLVAEEVKHPNSSYLPAMVFTVLNKRIPFHDDIQLTRWYGSDKGRDRWRVLHHRLIQATSCLLLFDALDMAGRAGEAARLSGVEFSQSFPGIRGSQYKVEGVLLRALKSIRSDERGAKRGHKKFPVPHDTPSSLSNESKSQTQSPWKVRRGINDVTKEDSRPIHNVSERNYFFYSPSAQDANKQEALECQALTLEPQSGCQQDPVVVCDFTALYPSLVIAYNLCYSTCAGKLQYHSTRVEMREEGRTTGRLGPFIYSETRTATVLKHHIKSLENTSTTTSHEGSNRRDRAYIAPTGCIYVSEAVLKGVLPQVLDEMLSTRAMLKKAAKQYKKLVPGLSPAIMRQLEARQLALKYVANVTYGYTSATFSGRCAMPILADTIVECARRTLTNAINLANKWGGDASGQWHGAEVIYGDTDSVFIKLPGKSVQEAFTFGDAFCEAVTASNPPPVQLKLEKVYYGSMMQTKKKYCGMKYESRDQKKSVFEAKGIETIRRDQCALTQKVLRNALVTLFSNGINAVKDYLFRQWSLILAGQIPVADFILTGRVRSQYRGGRVGPVQAVLARRLAEADPGRVVRHKERLSYVIVATPGLTFCLRDCVLTPLELLEQWDAYTIHSAYYITKHVNAALQRCLGLPPYFVDVNSWYQECPVPRKRIHFWPVTRSGSNVMISSYFGSDICSVCGSKCKAHGSARAVVCSDCRLDGVFVTADAMFRLNKVQKECQALAIICNRCNGCVEDARTFAPLKGSLMTRNKKIGSLVGTSVQRQTPGIVTPIANCTCINCPITFERHELREKELEAVAICEALGLS